MKISRTVLRAVVTTFCGALLISTLSAQDAVTQQRERGGTRAGALDAKTMGSSVRASKLIGMNIENQQQKNVGEINDIVLNSRTGEIQYVAVTYGGFLGVGNKMFAVPFEAFKVTKDPDDPNDPDDCVLVLDVTEKQLEGAKGFDENNWPSFADKTFTAELYKRYRVKRRWDGRTGDRGVDVKINREGIDVDVDSDKDN